MSRMPTPHALLDICDELAKLMVIEQIICPYLASAGKLGQPGIDFGEV